MQNVLSNRPLFERLRARVMRRPDTEFQQASIRIVIGLVFLAYFSSSLAPLNDDTRVAIQIVSALFTVAAVIFSALCLVDSQASPPRRIAAMFMDYATCSFLLTYAGEAGSPLLVVYLWVTLGNGFRYGVKYLYLAATMAVSGFVLVLFYSTYWSSHMAVGIAFLLSMIAVPLYSASLLRQLHEAVERERKANLAKSSFLANMSHELRTPLNGVIGVADLLADTRLNPEQQEYAQIIRSSASTLLDLIDNVLDISRIEAGRVNSTQENFDLHRLVNGTIALLDSQARGKGLVLTAHIAPQTPFKLIGDARHLRQVMINLVGNAIKFTEHGRIDVYIRPMGQAQRQRLLFEVVDTGIGIAESVQEKIFDSFTQADPTITRRFGGSGLGMAIAKQLVEALGGRIGLRSREGEGTTIWFEMPFVLQDDLGVSPDTQFDAPMRVAILAGSDLSERIQSLVRGWGGEAVLVDNTNELSAALAQSPDASPLAAVVVERNTIPGDPVAFLRLIRDDPRVTSIPTILVESGAQSDASQDANWVREGFASLLRTPVNPTLLFNAIHAAISVDMPHNVVSLAQHYRSQAGNAAALNVLVAEDNAINQRVVCGLLEHAGHRVFLAHDGEEALAMLESGEQAFDLAIVDMHMPRLAGTDLVKQWRFMESGHLPVIMLTADARSEAQTACENAGVDAFLTKPLNSRDLLDTIARLTGEAVAARKPATAPTPQVGELDETILDNLAQIGGAGFVQDLLTSFAADSERALRDIESALAVQDYGRWQDQLHMLKGGANDLGAVQLAQLCAEAERIKPYEMTSPSVYEKLDRVRLALIDAQAALELYLSQKLRTESV